MAQLSLAVSQGGGRGGGAGLAEEQTGGGDVEAGTAGGDVPPLSLLRLQLDDSPAGQNLQLVPGDQGGAGGQLTGVQTLSSLSLSLSSSSSSY